MEEQTRYLAKHPAHRDNRPGCLVVALEEHNPHTGEILFSVGWGNRLGGLLSKNPAERRMY